MAAGKWKVYDLAKKYLLDGTIDLDDTTNWKMALFTSASNADTLGSGIDVYGDLTNEVANGDGYTTGGEAVAGEALSVSTGTTTFDLDNVVWTASGAGITARSAVVYKNATVNSIVKPVLMTCLLDSTPADVSASAGNTLTVAINASGALTLTGATSN